MEKILTHSISEHTVIDSISTVQSFANVFNFPLEMNVSSTDAETYSFLSIYYSIVYVKFPAFSLNI